jgi:hypothetical protein
MNINSELTVAKERNVGSMSFECVALTRTSPNFGDITGIL